MKVQPCSRSPLVGVNRRAPRPHDLVAHVTAARGITAVHLENPRPLLLVRIAYITDARHPMPSRDVADEQGLGDTDTRGQDDKTMLLLWGPWNTRGKGVQCLSPSKPGVRGPGGKLTASRGAVDASSPLYHRKHVAAVSPTRMIPRDVCPSTSRHFNPRPAPSPTALHKRETVHPRCVSASGAEYRPPPRFLVTWDVCACVVHVLCLSSWDA